MKTAWGQRITAMLDSDPACAQLLGGRVTPNKKTQGGDCPAAVYQMVWDLPANSLQGFTSNLRNGRMQIDVYDRVYAGAQGAADAIEKVLASYTTIEFTSLQVSRRDLWEDETQLHRVSMDFNMWSNDQ